MVIRNVRVSFYVDEQTYNKLKSKADDMTVSRGIPTKVSDMAKKYVVDALKDN